MTTTKDKNGRMFCTGNIIEDSYGNIGIVTKVDDTYLSYVSATHSNTSGGVKPKAEKYQQMCYACEGMMKYCEDCGATGYIEQTRLGADSYTILADNMKDYIKDSLKKIFPIL